MTSTAYESVSCCCNFPTKYLWFLNNFLQEKADVAAKEADTAKAAWLCRVCLIAEVDITIVPCGHVLCRRCSSAVSRCPFCRLQVSKTIRIFRPWNGVHWWCFLLLSFQFLELQLKIVHGPWDSFVSYHNILSISPFYYVHRENEFKQNNLWSTVVDIVYRNFFFFTIWCV